MQRTSAARHKTSSSCSPRTTGRGMAPGVANKLAVSYEDARWSRRGAQTNAEEVLLVAERQQPRHIGRVCEADPADVCRRSREGVCQEAALLHLTELAECGQQRGFCDASPQVAHPKHAGCPRWHVARD
jgi:hypothetical protein